ncbi:2Fe-2S iron-sulfur cluster binding domain-containing protein [Salinimonas sp. HHU 13199]|uniref:2Fe-2S iron-sulfur cluster binding domain-containing protein n=1 Tax=Salinimonas profundi TaxID=2729140 RepID=A0ABR8LLB9_9ALTE|nr:2Fe-2S iron-sulfur cluster-binding protein [Salinimonas profundi]MBD3584739.1 2Fe-2S iron-sulfur cluster binding domain-containing protein [Salinimonas profundi]
MTRFGLIKQCHKWASVIVGVQLIIWLATGLYFGLAEHERLQLRPSSSPLGQTTTQHGEIVPASNLPVNQVQSLTLRTLLGKPVYVAVIEAGAHISQTSQIQLFDAISAAPISIEQPLAEKIAKHAYPGPSQIASATFRQAPLSELPGQKNDVWHIVFADEQNTYMFIDSRTGNIIAHSTLDRRFFDLMLKLHFMDYGNSGGFNHWLIITFALATLLFVITGLIWLGILIKDGQITPGRGKKTTFRATLNTGEAQLRISTRSSETILHALQHAHIHLPSACGGGGSCGKCRIQTPGDIKPTSAEREWLTSEELQNGMRLACQHTAADVDAIHAPKAYRDKLILEVEHARFVTPSIKYIQFTVKAGDLQAYKAGACMRFMIPPAENAIRPHDIPEYFTAYWQDTPSGYHAHDGGVRHYSIADFDAGKDTLSIAVKWQQSDDKTQSGIGSAYLCQLTTGQTIQAVGPIESFHLSDAAVAQRFFIGAGSGIAPLRAMIHEQLLKHKRVMPVTFLYGARTQADLAFQSEFEALSRQFSQFHYCPVLSRPDDNWPGQSGYVQDALVTILHQASFNPGMAEFYLCGPHPLMQDVETLLYRYGVSPANIYKDIFNPTASTNQ